MHWEFDFRDPVFGAAESALGLDMDQCTLNVRRTRHWKYVHFTALPPLLFDLASDPDELYNRARDASAQWALLREAQALLSWRMRHADKTLTHMRITPEKGLVIAS